MHQQLAYHHWTRKCWKCCPCLASPMHVTTGSKTQKHMYSPITTKCSSYYSSYSSTVLRPRSRNCSTTYWRQLTGGRCLFSASLIYISAAFDTVDHDLLLQRLERQFGLCGTALLWARSYLSGRTFRLVYDDVMSFIVYVMCSVLQGSVLGPLFFILYMADHAHWVASMACLFTLMLMTHSCTSISVALKLCHPLTNFSAVPWTSNTGCLLTDRSSTPIRQNWCLPAKVTAAPRLVAGIWYST